MSGMDVFGMMSFALVMVLWAKIQRMERVLRENGVWDAKNRDLAGQLRKQVGQTLTITMYDAGMDAVGMTARVLDVDETWALLLADEGKKKQREVLIRLDSVKQIKVK